MNVCSRKVNGPLLAIAGLLSVCTLLILYTNDMDSTVKLSAKQTRTMRTSSLTQDSTWYFPANNKVNTMGFEWADAERQIPTTVYTGSIGGYPSSDTIYQSPFATYTGDYATSSPDIIYQSTGTTQDYGAKPLQDDNIPQYIPIWNSPEEKNPDLDIIPQMIGKTVSARAKRVGAARTQSLYNIFDAPAHSRLNAIQAELDALKTPDQLRLHHPSKKPPPEPQDAPHGMVVWSLPPAGMFPPVLQGAAGL
jgi:hypothetical protein